MPTRSIQQFLKLESASGIVLLAMAGLSMLWANSPLAFIHEKFVGTFLFWINEGLMAVFFLLVGLEVKRSYRQQIASGFGKVLLPAGGAVGGMVVPALVYVAINYHHPFALKGWATPVPTDIAFAIGTLSLFGPRVPIGLKFFLLSLAIFDDVGAIVIIAFLFNQSISGLFLALSVALVGVLLVLNKLSVSRLAPYLFIGVLLWATLLYSGIHPTIAGVLLALTIPAGQQRHHSLLDQLEERLHPWVAYGIMPLFALANAGCALSDLSSWSWFDPIVWGVILGLFIGKQVGVFAASWLMIKCRLSTLPPHVSWLSLYGIALLCGIGFTMSLFLGTLAFHQDAIYLAKVRFGVIIGSLLSGACGSVMLAIAFAKKRVL